MHETNQMSPADFSQLAEDARQHTLLMNDDILTVIAKIYQIWWHWAEFTIFIVSPSIDRITPPLIIQPAIIPNSTEHEHVYPIHDHGYKFTTSKAPEMFTAGMSMCKLYNTIEKIIVLLIERLRDLGVDQTTEVQIAFGGHELAQRKAFESVINLTYNVLVTNYEPGNWGDKYLEIVKKLADLGYGYPPGAPRDSYRMLRK